MALDEAQHTPSSSTLVAELANYGIDETVRNALASMVDTAPGAMLYRFNPAYLAEEVALSRRAGLQLMAAAVQVGLFNLNWEARCIYCGYQAHAFDKLTQAHSKQYCAMCRDDFQAKLDDGIHVTFSVAERVRSLPAGIDNEAWREATDRRLGVTTSHELLTVQAFRDLFIDEPLPDGESFQIKWAALMFTDLGGSTALYARKGDPRAYSLVREHFNILFNVVNQAGGAVVKTIGDAIMAVFVDGAAAVKAGQNALIAIEAFNRERELADDERLTLKVGVHAGPTLAVTLNDRLDYFGTTVNAAARVQSSANYAELVVTQQVLEAPGVAEILPADLANETLILRGLDDLPFNVVRLQHTN
ncbi:adenylate/guanylate cyclase domain-containing protein [Herpetosiphon sp. NSE202]|uniref:adenylate/guanylate cyclase domain-containing protein n=1 Tax=Herpetosiphon sp. NSE202 TaxID=3351349 RepID=UPI003639C04A